MNSVVRLIWKRLPLKLLQVCVCVCECDGGWGPGWGQAGAASETRLAGWFQGCTGQPPA